MKALKLLGPGNIALEEMAAKPLENGWCRIKVLSVGVCGSDISSMAGRLMFTKFPIIPGHEFSGTVTETNGCGKIAVGDFVTANPIFSCGKCPACLRGDVNHCSQTQVLGVVDHDGAYAEEVVLPEHMVYKLSDNMSAEEGAMIEATNVAMRSLDRGNVKPGDKVAIFGAGNIGLVVVALAKHIYGAGRVLVFDTVPSRLEVAKQMGADEVMTIAEMTEKMDNLRSNFDQVIDGVGIENTVRPAISLARPGGAVVIYGVPAGTFPVDVSEAFKKDLTIHLDRLYPKSMEKAISILAEGKVDFAPMITHRCSLEEFPEIARKVMAKELDSIKIIVNVGEK